MGLILFSYGGTYLIVTPVGPNTDQASLNKVAINKIQDNLDFVSVAGLVVAVGGTYVALASWLESRKDRRFEEFKHYISESIQDLEKSLNTCNERLEMNHQKLQSEVWEEIESLEQQTKKTLVSIELEALKGLERVSCLEIEVAKASASLGSNTISSLLIETKVDVSILKEKLQSLLEARLKNS